MELLPSAPPMAFAQWLRTHSGLSTTVLVVGHEPQLSLFASWILAGKMESFVQLKKSGVLILEIENLQDPRPGGGTLRTLINPSVI